MKLFWVYLGVLVGVGLLLQAFAAGEARVPYARFRELAEQGSLGAVDIQDEVYVGRAPPGQGTRIVRTGRLPESEKTFLELLDARGIPYTRLPDSHPLMPLLAWSLPLLGVGLILHAFASRKLSAPAVANPALSFGKNKARLYVDQGKAVTFRDVAGCEEAKTELAELVEYLRWPERFKRLGGRAPKGVLLVGPPGTGKTLLARAVAGEANVPFYSVCGSAFVELFVGVGAARVRDLFAQAQEKPAGLIFIDELDALGKMRGPAGPIGGNDEREQTLNQLLTEMDGFQAHTGLILLAATNRPEILDPALLRPGRFDRRILVDRPDLEERRAILQVHARKLLLGGDVDLDGLARQTPGLVGAELANLANEAALLAARRRGEAVTQADFDAALERALTGIERPTRRLQAEERRLVAYHEAGHGLLAELLHTQDPVRKLSILPRGNGALGFTLQQPLTDKNLVSRREILDRLVVLLGGRLAEELAVGDVSSGAQDDLLKATELARRMVRELGMGEELGLVALAPAERGGFAGLGAPEHGDATLQAVDSEVRRLMDQARARGARLLEQHREALDRVAARLRQAETLSGSELRALIAGGAGTSEAGGARRDAGDRPPSGLGGPGALGAPGST